MRTYFGLLGASVLLCLGSACTVTKPPAAAESDFRPTATIKDIMDAVVDPGADDVWNAVATVITKDGEAEKSPKTDEEWTNIRRSAIRLIEGTNLILVPGRRIARPGEKADDPKVELPPEQIQEMVDKDRPAFVMLAHGLHDAVMVALKAIDSKDSQALLDAGDGIDKACEACHMKYWYPGEAKNQAPESVRK